MFGNFWKTNSYKYFPNFPKFLKIQNSRQQFDIPVQYSCFGENQFIFKVLVRAIIAPTYFGPKSGEH